MAFDIRKNKFVTKATGCDVKRARFQDQSGESKGLLPCYIVFDILYLNGEVSDHYFIILSVLMVFQYSV